MRTTLSTVSLALLLSAAPALADIRQVTTPAETPLVLAGDGVIGCADPAVEVSAAAEFGRLEPWGPGIRYTPNSGFSGGDTFEYATTCSGRNAGLGVHFVIVTVTGTTPSDLVLASGTNAALAHGQRLVIGHGASFGCAIEGNQITLGPDHGSLTPRGSALLYASQPSFIGIDSFEAYPTCNGARSPANGARFQIVTVAPLAGVVQPQPDIVVAAGDSALLDQGQSALIPVAAVFGCDLQGSQILAGAANGRVSPRGSAVLYAPNTGFAGADSFTYQPSCAGRAILAPQLFRVTVNPPKAQFRLSVAVAGTGGGRITSSPPAIDCKTGREDACAAVFIGGTSIALTEAADAGSRFTSWSGSCLDRGNGTGVIVLGADAVCTVRFDRPETVPDSGWWWSSAEPGAGYSIEVRGGTLLIAASMYREDGSPVWYLAEGPLLNSAFEAQLREFAGGPAVGAPWHGASPAEPAGTIRLAFDTPASGTVSFMTAAGSRSIGIRRFAVASASSADLAPIARPTAGGGIAAAPVLAAGARPVAVGGAAGPRLIVKLRQPSSPAASAAGSAAPAPSAFARMQESLGSQVAYASDVLPWLLLKPSPEGLSVLLGHSDVESVSEERWLAANLWESVPQIGADRLWALGYKAEGRTVAILDTGVDATHPFFGGRVVAEACFSTSGAGYTSLCRNGGPFEEGAGAGRNCDPLIYGCFHGTHVAGIAAGAGRAFSGVAPASGIAAVKVFAKLDPSLCGADTRVCIGASDADIMLALDWVYRNASRLDIAAVNLSLGGGAVPGFCDDQPIKVQIDALRARGVATVIAAGNDGDPRHISYPACISSAIAVGAVTKADRDASFSNLWPLTLLLAPGDGIYSSLPGGQFGYLSGTSMATPHVAGSWALLQSAAGAAGVDRILAALSATGIGVADPVTRVAHPRINVAAAYASLRAGMQPETDWWWNADQPGIGFFFEIAGGEAYLSRFAYDGDGRDAWFISSGAMAPSSLFQAPLLRCTGGQSLGGPPRAPSCSPSGTLTVQFQTATTASLLLDDGRRLALTRYAF
ncbi:MAG: S8 family serine peptidase [Proteobacteria bacterium]|nr:S8 family serine peptidase [Pseudomonadota bacterium]